MLTHLVFGQPKYADQTEALLQRSREDLLRGAQQSAEEFDTVKIVVAPGWNLISLPKTLAENTVASLFPSAISQAYQFNNGYVATDMFAAGYDNGLGYWLKFAEADTVSFVTCPTTPMYRAPIQTGWNIVGSSSRKVLTDTIKTEPESIILTSFYEYIPGLGYAEADTIQPGKGYWVKLSKEGEIKFLEYGGGPEPELLPYYFDYPAWHPAGTWIAVEHSESLDTNNDDIKDYRFYGIWLVHSVTGDRKPLIENFRSPSWNSDGTELAMVSGGNIYKVTVTDIDSTQYDTSSLIQDRKSVV